MNAAIVRGALWAVDLSRIAPLEHDCSDFTLIEVRSERLVVHLARAMCLEIGAVHERLERGSRAFAAMSRRGEVAAWLWVSTGQEWALPLRRTFRFQPDECYGWNAGTQERHRGRGLFTGLLRFAGWRMAQEGVRWLWGGILDDNLASQRANAAAGSRPILRLTASFDTKPGRLWTRRVDYADPELVARARRLLDQETERP
ncbi:MAG TPA: hypothetical protein VIC57_17825 [Candidatus Dormibacteraeota bacterium]